MRRGPHNPAITWTPHIRVSWGGTLGQGPDEIWTNSMKFVPAGGVLPTPAALDQICTLVVPALTAWVNVRQNNTGTEDPYSFISSVAHLSWVKANAILASGLQRDNATHQHDIAPFVAGWAAVTNFNQTFALTFRSELRRGRGHAGRIFPPAVYGNIQANGRIGPMDGAAMAGAGARLIKAMRDAIDTVQVGDFCILSPGNTTKGTTPMRENIVSVECDTVPDVQHRRTRQMKRQIGTVASTVGA